MREDIKTIGAEVHEVENAEGTQRYLLIEGKHTDAVILKLQAKRPGIGEESDPWLDVMGVKSIRGETTVMVNALLTKLRKPKEEKTESPALVQRHSYDSTGEREEQETWFLSKTDNPDQELKDLKELGLFYKKTDLPKTINAGKTIGAFLTAARTGEFSKPVLVLSPVEAIISRGAELNEKISQDGLIQVRFHERLYEITQESFHLSLAARAEKGEGKFRPIIGFMVDQEGRLSLSIQAIASEEVIEQRSDRKSTQTMHVAYDEDGKSTYRGDLSNPDFELWGLICLSL